MTENKDNNTNKGKSEKDYAKDYTKPKLRADLKEKIKEEDKGGKSGQWSARKSQMLNKKYEDEGGGYKHSGDKTSSQKDLEKWSKEDWQTSDDTKAVGAKSTKRYLPKEVWDKLSPTEKKQANESKTTLSKMGKQNVENPSSVKRKLKEVRDES